MPHICRCATCGRQMDDFLPVPSIPNLLPCECVGAICALSCNPIMLATGRYCKMPRAQSGDRK